MTLHLGRTPATEDHRDIKLSAVLDVERVNAKPYKPHDHGFKLQMYANGPDQTAPAGANDGVGDCVFAMFSNAVQLWRHAAGQPYAALNGTTAIHAYSEVTGYRVGVASTDQGTDMRVAASWMRKTGMKDLEGKRHKIGAYLSITPGDSAQMQAAIRAFGAVGIGINFPDYAMREFDAKQNWTYRAGGTNDGGHAILGSRPLSTGIDVYSWARELQANRAFLQHQCEEAWAYVSLEFLKDGQSPEGLDQAALLKVLGTLG